MKQGRNIRDLIFSTEKFQSHCYFFARVYLFPRACNFAKRLCQIFVFVEWKISSLLREGTLNRKCYDIRRNLGARWHTNSRGSQKCLSRLKRRDKSYQRGVLAFSDLDTLPWLLAMKRRRKREERREEERGGERTLLFLSAMQIEEPYDTLAARSSALGSRVQVPRKSPRRSDSNTSINRGALSWIAANFLTGRTSIHVSRRLVFTGSTTTFFSFLFFVSLLPSMQSRNVLFLQSVKDFRLARHFRHWQNPSLRRRKKVAE